ncbi:MAG TPA: ComEC/Rec2 family competence protein [Mycobacteriales bacterium]|nr:ComEC/Rec2 family competence protein [Mycobacteriales bacterium]
MGAPASQPRSGRPPAPAEPPDRSTSASPAADLRLLAGALAAWLAVLAALGMPAAAGLAAGAIAVAASAALLLTRRRWAAAAALVLGCAGAGALATAARVGGVQASPLTVLAGERASVTVDLMVADDPRLLRAGTGPERVAVPARAEHASAADRSWSMRDRVLVLAPAEGWRPLLPGQRLRATGRLAPPLRRDLTVAVLSVRAAPRDVQPPSRAQTAAGRIRSGLRDAAAVLPEAPRGLLPGLVLGDTSALDPALAEDFRTAGLSHLTAVSGTNCTIVTGAVLLLLRLATVGPRASAAAAGLALAGFVVLARPSPSVLRAALMGGLALIALASGRARTALPALGATVLGLVLVAPPLARDPGFALSVLATLGLLVLAPGWAAHLRARGVPRGAAEALAVPAAASLCTAPVVAVISGQVSLVCVPANLLAAPAVAPATVLGVLAAVVSPLSGSAAGWLARLAGLPVGWLAEVGQRSAHLPAAAVSWPGGAGGGLLLVAACLLGVVIARRAALRRVVLAAAMGAVVVAVPARVAAPGWPPAGWIFVACTVGQGDALVVRAGPAAAVVVDTGPEPVPVDGCLRRLGVRAVPLLLVTHLHADHVGGIAGVTRGRTVAEIDVGRSREPVAGWRMLERSAAERRVPVRTVAVGERREVAGVVLDVLGPARDFRGTRSDPNNSSVVLRVRARGRSLLLTGDAEVEAQEAMVRSGMDLRADCLKVPHHGSAYQSQAFLRAVHPSVAVISVGAGNGYGHPSGLLLAELAREGPRTLRTDVDGDVAVADQRGQLVVVARSGRPP